MYYFPFSSASSFIPPNIFISAFPSTFTFLYAFPPPYVNGRAAGLCVTWVLTFWPSVNQHRVHRSTIMPCSNNERQETRREKKHLMLPLKTTEHRNVMADRSRRSEYDKVGTARFY